MKKAIKLDDTLKLNAEFLSKLPEQSKLEFYKKFIGHTFTDTNSDTVLLLEVLEPFHEKNYRIDENYEPPVRWQNNHHSYIAFINADKEFDQQEIVIPCDEILADMTEPLPKFDNKETK